MKFEEVQGMEKLEDETWYSANNEIDLNEKDDGLKNFDSETDANDI